MKSFIKQNGAWLGLFALLIILVIATDGDFLSSRNLSNLIRQAAINGILAGGMTLVILTGGIDLSIGSIVALCGIMVGVSQVHWQWDGLGTTGAMYSSLISVAVGLFLGLVSGSLIAFLRIAPFVITLGMMVIARGIAMIVSDGSGISPMSDSLNFISSAYLPSVLGIAAIAIFLIVFGTRIFAKPKSEWINGALPLITFVMIAISFLTYKGFPILVLVLLFTLVCLHGLLKYTTLGRSIYAIGSNERAAYWSGVPIKKTNLIVYAIMGALAGLAGLLLTSRLNGADPNAGQLFELDAIAAVVIGGTSLKGGTGSIIGSFIGALMIASLNNGMDLLGVPSFYQMVLKGIIIIFAVSLDSAQRKAVV